MNFNRHKLEQYINNPKTFTEYCGRPLTRMPKILFNYRKKQQELLHQLEALTKPIFIFEKLSEEERKAIKQTITDQTQLIYRIKDAMSLTQDLLKNEPFSGQLIFSHKTEQRLEIFQQKLSEMNRKNTNN